MRKQIPVSGSGRCSSRGGAAAFALVIVAVLAVLAAAYVAFTLHWSYSEGDRAGIVQKFSHKGWVFKTWEGELAMSIVPGVTPTIWNFSVRDPKVAQEITTSLGKRVALHYTEHRGVPTSVFAETPYFVDRVRVVE